MQKLYTLTAVDVRLAEQDGTSRFTTIDKLTMPSIEFTTAGHNPGGGIGEVEFNLPRIAALQPAFAVKGLDTDIFGLLGERHRWVFAAAYKDQNTGLDVAHRAVIEGSVSQWEPDETSPTEFQGCNHVLKEVTFYELVHNGEELFHWDFWNGIIRTGGVDHTAGVRTALGI
ncbi:P2 family phage contractile tail tube protein [Labrenzia sp. EL_126]|nr:P2 family phage contractile tail tube protein [Labrenzia sp. EL_126]